MSYWPSGLTRHRNRQSDPARAHTVSSASIIAIGAVLTTFVIIGTLALHRSDPFADENHWATPLPTGPLLQPEMPEPVPVLPAPSSSAPIAEAKAPAVHRPSPAPRKPDPVAPAPPPAPAPEPLIPAAGSRISLVTAGGSGLRVRHQNFQLRLDRIDPRSPALDRSDATFIVRSGLAGKSCVSLEAVNYPGRFIRHQNFSLVLHPRQASGQFAADATFCAQPVDSGGVFVLRAVNFPDRYLTVRNSALRLSRVPAGDALRFRAAAGL